MAERRVVHYRGRVQGVGFRFTTRRIADRYRVSGYVKNLADGRVEVVAEGEAAEIERFLGDVESRMAGFIAGSEQQVEPVDQVASSFTIQY